MTSWRKFVEFFTFSIFSLSCGRNTLARTIGPATNGGKNATNKENSFKVLQGFRLPRYISKI